MQAQRSAPTDTISRGSAIFAEKIQSQLADLDPFLFVAIDVETEEFAVNASSLTATRTLLTENPNAQVYLRRVGFPVTHWYDGNVPRTSGPRWRKRPS